MWTRRNVKRRGRNAMRANYWKTVLVSLILTCVLGGASGASSAGSSAAAAAGSAGSAAAVQSQSQTQSGDVYEGLLSEDPLADAGSDINTLPPEAVSAMEESGSGIRSLPTSPEAVTDEIINHMPGRFINIEIPDDKKMPVLIALCVVFLIIVAIAILIDAFLFNPLEVGIRRFFFMNMRGPAEIKEVAYGYDHKYLKNVKIIFLRDLCLFLWTLLLIFPGIIKSYSYRMVPYILADQPELTRKEIFTLSKKLMHGNKWKAFVLDLSFIGWYILSVLTLGILHVFFVAPYKNMTDAALYEKLMYGRKNQGGIQTVPVIAEDDEADEEAGL